MTSNDIKKFLPQFKFEVNLTTIGALLMVIASWGISFGQMRAERTTFATKTELATAKTEIEKSLTSVIVKEENLEKAVGSHFTSDAEKFGALASKETRAARDREVDGMFKAILDELKDIKGRMRSIEQMHMKDR